MRKLSLRESIDHLPRWFELGLQTDSTAFMEALRGLHFQPTAIIGSGASYSSAVLLAKCLETHLQCASKAFPPFEYRHSASAYPGVVLISAGGANEDILAAQAVALTQQVKPLVLLTTDVNSPLLNESSDYPARSVALIPRDPLQTCDGFLGTVSLVAIWALIAKVISEILGRNHDSLKAWFDTSIERARLHMSVAASRLREISLRKHIVALGTGWSVPVMVDFESKMVESGLGWIEVAEAKHFTHGRFVNSYRYEDDTALFVFATEDDHRLSEALTQSYGRRLLVEPIISEHRGLRGSLDLMVKALLLIDALSVHREIDVSHPVVPEEAREMFQGLGLYPSAPEKAWINEIADRITLRKRAIASAELLGEVDHRVPGSVVRAAYSEMLKTTFGGLVCDFDGTLVPLESGSDVPDGRITSALILLLKAGIPVAVITGRGHSAIRGLRACIDLRLQSNVFCFLYNGAAFYRLDRNEPDGIERLHNIREIANTLDDLKHSDDVLEIEISPLECQITIRLAHRVNQERERTLVSSIRQRVPNWVSVGCSGRSVDLFPVDCSKRRALQLFRDHLCGTAEVTDLLALGDRGDRLGNDYEMLQHQFSISVDRFDWNPSTCFPSLDLLSNVSGPIGTARILSEIQVCDGGFRLGYGQSA